MKTIDGVYRQEAARRAPSVAYIDSWRFLDGRNGAYEGRLRQPDVVHLAPRGSFRLADAVYRIIEKDWRIRRAPGARSGSAGTGYLACPHGRREPGRPYRVGPG
jgi:hypothetical protein